MTIILAKLSICYEHKETRSIIGWYEYQIADDVTRYVPLYSKNDRIRAKKFWQRSWDGLPEDWID